MMIPIENLADSTIEFIAQKVKENPEIDLKPMMQYFSIDVICKVAFGLDTKCRTEEDPDMHKLFTSIMEDFKFDTYPKATIWAILSHFPELLSKLGFWPASMLKMRTMTKDIMTEREQKNIKIGDFVDRLMEYKKVAELPITDEMIEAQGGFHGRWFPNNCKYIGINVLSSLQASTRTRKNC